MNPNETTNNGDALLIAFANDYESGTATVTDWAARYPALARDFVRIAADPRGHESADDRTNAVLLRSLRKQKNAYLGAAAFASLVDKERSITAAKIAQAIALPLPFVAKLNQRLFRAATLPARLVEKLADAVGRSVDDVTAYLSAPPTLARNAAYSNPDAPTLGEAEDFAVALQRDADVSAEARMMYAVGE